MNKNIFLILFFTVIIVLSGCKEKEDYDIDSIENALYQMENARRAASLIEINIENISSDLYIKNSSNIVAIIKAVSGSEVINIKELFLSMKLENKTILCQAEDIEKYQVYLSGEIIDTTTIEGEKIGVITYKGCNIDDNIVLPENIEISLSTNEDGRIFQLDTRIVSFSGIEKNISIWR